MAYVAPELDLHGLTAEDALLSLDLYLNEAFLAGLTSVRIVHGKGTGTLRRVVREALHRHSLVRSFRVAQPAQGGDGAVTVELVDNS